MAPASRILSAKACSVQRRRSSSIHPAFRGQELRHGPRPQALGAARERWGRQSQCSRPTGVSPQARGSSDSILLLFLSSCFHHSDERHGLRVGRLGYPHAGKKMGNTESSVAAHPSQSCPSTSVSGILRLGSKMLRNSHCQ